MQILSAEIIQFMQDCITFCGVYSNADPYFFAVRSTLHEIFFALLEKTLSIFIHHFHVNFHRSVKCAFLKLSVFPTHYVKVFC